MDRFYSSCFGTYFGIETLVVDRVPRKNNIISDFSPDILNFT
jgi:hypothetical protein